MVILSVSVTTSITYATSNFTDNEVFAITSRFQRTPPFHIRLRRSGGMLHTLHNQGYNYNQRHNLQQYSAVLLLSDCLYDLYNIYLLSDRKRKY